MSWGSRFGNFAKKSDANIFHKYHDGFRVQSQPSRKMPWLQSHAINSGSCWAKLFNFRSLGFWHSLPKAPCHPYRRAIVASSSCSARSASASRWHLPLQTIMYASFGYSHGRRPNSYRLWCTANVRFVRPHFSHRGDLPRISARFTRHSGCLSSFL
jgi:hypothetical protein